MNLSVHKRTVNQDTGRQFPKPVRTGHHGDPGESRGFPSRRGQGLSHGAGMHAV